MHPSEKVDQYIESLPDEERLVAETLREMIFDLVPNVEERFSFKIPFYHYYGMFCYLNRVKSGGLELAFCRGKDLILAYPELQLKGRAMIAGITIMKVRSMPESQLRTLIAGAAAWQQEASMVKKPFILSRKASRKKKK
jgi:hypothetical protein